MTPRALWHARLAHGLFVLAAITHGLAAYVCAFDGRPLQAFAHAVGVGACVLLAALMHRWTTR